MSQPFLMPANLPNELALNPDHLYVTDAYIAAMMPNWFILVIPGDFSTPPTAEQANEKLQEALAILQQD